MFLGSTTGINNNNYMNNNKNTNDNNNNNNNSTNNKNDNNKNDNSEFWGRGIFALPCKADLTRVKLI